MDAVKDVSSLAKEYKDTIKSAATKSAAHISHDINKLTKLLVSEGEWSPRAAAHLIRLSKDYGSFMLRNALALSLALEIEDGALGF